MRAIVLIALNYAREQRWAVVLLLVWSVFSALLAALGQLEREDVLFFIKQQAIYGVALSSFLAAAATYNERRTRRILSVLSKGIERREYLAGLLGGVLLATALYLFAMGVFGSLMFSTAGMPAGHLWELLVLLFVACALGATTALLFGAFAPPIVAVALAGTLLGTNVVLAQLGVTGNFLPVYVLVGQVMGYTYDPGWLPLWTPAIWSIVQTVGVWLVASWIFGRRDIAVALE